MHKVVINRCYGGFGLSKEAIERYEQLSGVEALFLSTQVKRHDPILVQVVEELGSEAASDRLAKLFVHSLPPNTTKYRIGEYDGVEWVETPETIDWIELET